MDHKNRLASTSTALAIMALTASAAIAVGASPAPSGVGAAPYGPAANGTIVYGKEGDIWTVDAEGQDPPHSSRGRPRTSGRSTHGMARSCCSNGTWPESHRA